MKSRTISVLLTLALLLAFTPCLTASAAEPQFRIEPIAESPATVYAPGVPITAKVCLDNAEGFLSAQFLLEWDPAALSFEKLTLPEGEGIVANGTQTGEGTAVCSVVLQSPCADEVLVIAYLQLKIEKITKNGCEVGVSVRDNDIDGIPEPARYTFELLGLSPDEMDELAEQETAAAPTGPDSGQEEHNSALDDFYLGDADGNGKVTAADARAILRHAARLQMLDEAYAPLCDVDSDGKIKAADARYALRMAARLEGLYTYKYGVHDHVFTEEITKEPTCTEDGELTRTCTVCGAVTAETIPAGHQFTERVTKEPTCTEPGELTKTCSVCGAVETDPIPARGHQFAEQVTKQPSCTEPGELTKTCSVCGAAEKETLDALGHNFVSAEPYGPRYCSRCGVSETALRASELKISVKTDRVTLKKNGAVPVHIDITSPDDLVCSISVESSSEAVEAFWLADENGDLSDDILITALKNVTGAVVTVYFDDAPEIRATVRVDVSSSGSGNYSGADYLKKVPDFGIFAGAAPVGGSVSTDGDIVEYVYEEKAVVPPGEDGVYIIDKYRDLLHTKGFKDSENPYGGRFGEIRNEYKGDVRVFCRLITDGTEDENGNDIRYLVVTVTNGKTFYKSFG